MRLAMLLIFVLLTPGLARVLWQLALTLGSDLPLTLRLAAGLAAGAALHRLLLRRLPGLMIFQHEAKHALAALLFLRRIERFSVTWRRGGEVRYGAGFGGRFGDHTIAMAPYFALPLALCAGALQPLVQPSWQAWYQALFGALLAIDLLNIVVDLRSNFSKDRFVTVGGQVARTDIGQRGYAFTVAAVAFFGALLLIIALSLALQGYQSLPALAQAVGAAWWDTGVWLWARGGELVRALRA